MRIYVQPHPLLKRDGADLYTVLSITFPDAALGSKVKVPCLEGEFVLLSVPAGTQSGTALRVRGKGMPRLHGKGKGDLLLMVEVKTPTELTARQRELLREFSKLDAEQKGAPQYFQKIAEPALSPWQNITAVGNPPIVRPGPM